MDRASCALRQGVPAGVPQSFRALADHRDVPRSTLYYRSRGRQSIEDKAESQQYLTAAEEKAVVDFLLQMSDLGHPVRIKYIPYIAFGATRYRPAPSRPANPPGKNWAKALEKRHPILQARRVKALDWDRHEKNIYSKICHWFEVIGKMIQSPDVLVENIYNMDETGVMLSMLGSVKVLVGKEDTRNYRGGRVKRETVTAIECISADGRYLNPLIIWPATTHRSNWTIFPTPGWHYAFSESGYTDSKISLEWLRLVFDPQTRERAGSKPRVLICDGFGTHETLEILEFCFANNITLCRLPSHTSHKLQPCDLAIFSPLKAAYRDNVERLERGGVNTIGKQHFTSLYSPAREITLSKSNITAAWNKAGLIPFHPDRVLSDMPKPTSETANEPRKAISIPDVMPGTPSTPVSIEALMSLQSMIVQHDTSTLDETSKRNLERHLKKLTKAAGVFYAKNVLQEDRIGFLLKTNNESKIRRATKSLVLGRAKVMSYEDLVTARTKRAEEEAVRARKALARAEKEAAGQYKPKSAQRKRQGDTVEGYAQDCTVKMPCANDTAAVSNDDTWAGDYVVDVARYRAPEARMY